MVSRAPFNFTLLTRGRVAIGANRVKPTEQMAKEGADDREHQAQLQPDCIDKYKLAPC